MLDRSSIVKWVIKGRLATMAILKDNNGILEPTTGPSLQPPTA